MRPFLLRLLVLTVILMSKPRTAQAVAVKNVCVVGAGVQGTSVAYFLSETDPSLKITLLESIKPASAASGKGGGFMARSWGDGSPTQQLHELAFDLYEELADTLNLQSYRKLPVLSVSPTGQGGIQKAQRQFASILPSWLDGSQVGRISPLGMGDDTAQVTPTEVVSKMIDSSDNIRVVLGQCTGVKAEGGRVTHVCYRHDEKDDTLATDAVVVSAGPWSCKAEDWFPNAELQLPMEGIKSTSIVWKNPLEDNAVPHATALFCGENHRYGTHLEVYPRPDGTVYVCGIGGSDYISTEQLKAGAFNAVCMPNEARVDAAAASFRELSSLYQQKGELDRTQACMRPCPPDALPYMGRVRNYDNCYINAGHNCWGIAWAPACGLAMSELVLEGACSRLNLDPFDPSRFAPTQSSRGRKKRGQNVGEQW